MTNVGAELDTIGKVYGWRTSTNCLIKCNYLGTRYKIAYLQKNIKNGHETSKRKHLTITVYFSKYSAEYLVSQK